MSDGADDIAKVQHDVSDAFAKIFFGLAGTRKRQHDYFTFKQFGDLVNVKSVFDGKQEMCLLGKDLEKTISDVVGKTDLYENLTGKIPVHDGMNGNVKDYFTPKMFNDLGGINSDILKNVESIGVNESGLIKQSYLHLANGASPHYTGFFISHHNDNQEYRAGLCDLQGRIEKWLKFKDNELQKELKDVLKFNEKAHLANKKEGYLFSEDEVSKEKLKQAGIKWSDLSETQKNDLLRGKETSSITITRNEKGKKIYEKGHLKLSRTGANSADILFRQQIGGGIKKALIFKL